MFKERQRAQEIEQALQADLQAVRELQPPGFRLDAAVAKFAGKTRSDERAAAWAARVEQQPATAMLANLLDRVGLRKLVVASVLLFCGAATAGTVTVLAMRPLTPSRTVPVATIATHEREPAVAPPSTEIEVTPLPVPAPKVSPRSPLAPRRHTPAAATNNGVEQEIAHMVMLRKLVERNPRRALAWAEQGHRKFVQGALFEEREALYVLALIKVEGANAASPRARAFLRRFPKGSFAARIQHAVKP